MKTKEELAEEYIRTLDRKHRLNCIEPAFIAGFEKGVLQFKDDNGRATYYENKVDMLNRIANNKLNEITRKIETHIETNEWYIAFNIDKTTKGFLEQDNKLLREIIKSLK